MLAYDDQRADAYVMDGIARHHPEIFQMVGLDGTDELPTLPLRQFRALWIAETSLREGSSLVQPPTPLAPTHRFLCHEDYELLAKYCSNSNFFYLQKEAKIFLYKFMLESFVHDKIFTHIPNINFLL